MCDIENACETSCARCRRKENATYIRSMRAAAPMTQEELVHEARRCLYCANPGCMATGCPTQLDARRMVHAAGERNFYEAARVALTANPMALSCGRLCPADTCCKSACNLGKTRAGPIAINEIQQYSLERFFEYRVPATRKVTCQKRVAVVGAGPAGLSAAAFLARMGVATIDVFEKGAHPGGIVAAEIPYFRCPREVTDNEAAIVASYEGVTIHYNTPVDAAKLDELAKSYDAVFVGAGRNGAAIEFEGTVTARDFLADVNKEFKFHEGKSQYADLKGKRVVVMGSGDVAADCAEVAQRHGAAYTALLMREDVRTATCAKETMVGVINQNIEIIPAMLPQRVARNDKGEVCGVVCKDLIDTASPERTIPADLVICAFGVRRDPAVLAPGATVAAADSGKLRENVFCGGDYAGANLIVEAVNDARVAVLRMADLLGLPKVIPRFTTVVDDVDLSIEVDGVKYVNPLGISSAPVSGTYEHLKRCFEAGFGFALTKTYPLEKDIQKNNHIRIVKVYDSPESTSYNNIVMISEHPHTYWLDSIRKLKAEFPDRIVIASIMCMDNEADWRLLSKLTEEAGADAIELNFSCPNECHGNDGNEGGCEGGFKSKNAMAMAIGTNPDAIRRCTRYVTSTVKIPVYPKLTPNVGNIEDLAAAAMEGGAAGVSLINTVFGISQITLSGHPWPQVGVHQNTISGGLSGDLVRPIAIRQIAQVLRFNPEIGGHLLGIGGCRSADTAMQLIYTGASIVQMCSVVQKYSYDVVDEMLSGIRFILYCWSRPDLRAYLNSQGVESFMPQGDKHQAFWELPCAQDKPVPKLADVRGLALSHIGERHTLEGPEKWRVHADILADRCIGCGSCALTCRDNATTAIHPDESGRIYVVDDSKCFGCALCSSVCPVNAIRYVAMKGLDDLTDAERNAIPTGF